MTDAGNQASIKAMCNRTISFALVLVTYGSRASLVCRAVDQALEHSSVKKVIIVDNDSAVRFDYSKYNIDQHERIAVLRQNINTGSAGGYSIGIDFARRLDEIDFVILMDDDLLIHHQTIVDLSKFIGSSKEQNALVIPRSDRPDQIASLKIGYAPVIRKNSFHDFHVYHWRRALGRDRETVSAEAKGLSVDFAPYAGMVLSVDLIRRAELPDKEFYVYCDDYDYLMKLKAAGAEPLLLNVAPLQSIDESWNQKRGRAPAIFSPDAPVFRVYYSLRNRVVFELRHTVSSKAIYGMNMIAFFVIGGLVSLIESGVDRSLFRRFRLLAAATSDGMRGRLGQNLDTVERYSK
jgi:GT2 family glycosyltransferase